MPATNRVTWPRWSSSNWWEREESIPGPPQQSLQFFGVRQSSCLGVGARGDACDLAQGRIIDYCMEDRCPLTQVGRCA